jgi:RNA polymerase sigma factor (sigma-70 family)
MSAIDSEWTTRQETCQQLYSQLEAGDPNARNELITLNMDLVKKQVRAYRKNQGLDLGELEGAGMTTLIECVDTLLQNKPPGVANYISSAIKFGVITEYRKQKRERQGVKSIDGLEEDKHPVAPDEIAAVVEKEEVLACCSDATDVAIVTERSSNATYSEVAEAIGISTSTAHTRLKQVEARFDSRSERVTVTHPLSTKIAKGMLHFVGHEQYRQGDVKPSTGQSLLTPTRISVSSERFTGMAGVAATSSGGKGAK